MKDKYGWVGWFILMAGFGVWAMNAGALSDPLTRFTSYEITCSSTGATFRNTAGFTPTHAIKLLNGSTEIFLGGRNVNATTLGTSLAANASLSLDGSAASLYCITASGTSVVDVFGAD